MVVAFFLILTLLYPIVIFFRTMRDKFHLSIKSRPPPLVFKKIKIRGERGLSTPKAKRGIEPILLGRKMALNHRSITCPTTFPFHTSSYLPFLYLILPFLSLLFPFSLFPLFSPILTLIKSKWAKSH